jgi:hypothetical protein
MLDRLAKNFKLANFALKLNPLELQGSHPLLSGLDFFFYIRPISHSR